MKKFITMIAVLAMSMSFAACGEKPAETAPAPQGEAQTEQSEEPDEEQKEDEENNEGEEKVTKIALLISGTLGDKSFHDSSKAGLDIIQEKYGDKVETKVIEMGSDKTKFIPTLEDVSEQGYDLVLTGTFHMKEPVEEVAPNYPDTVYVIYDTAVAYDEIDGLDNVYSISYKQNEAGFLAGYIAASVTQDTNLENINDQKVIGFLGATDVPVINDFLVGYIEGAKYFDPETKVDIAYIDSFTDAARGKELSLIQYKDNGVDIAFNVAGRAGLGQIDAAAEMGTYAIGVDSDQASLFPDNEEKSSRIVTSALKRIDLSLERAVDMYFEGTIPVGTEEVLGLKENGVGIVENDNFNNLVSDETKVGLEKVKEEVESGTIKIKSALGMDSAELAEFKNSAK